jgi:hypothetical protein
MAGHVTDSTKGVEPINPHARIQGGTTAVLRTPSAIIPTECNYILNSAHPDFRKLRIGTPAPFGFDPRMWK